MGDDFHKFGTLMLFGKTYMLHSGPTPWAYNSWTLRLNHNTIRHTYHTASFFHREKNLENFTFRQQFAKISSNEQCLQLCSLKSQQSRDSHT